MTQAGLDFLLTKLKCCSATLAIEIADSLVIGGCDNSRKLILLNNLIKEIAKYDLDNLEINCLSEDQFDNVVQKAKIIRGKCDCGDNSENS
mgnify:FL=1